MTDEEKEPTPADIERQLRAVAAAARNAHPPGALLNAARKIMRQLESEHPAAEFKKKFRQRWLKALEIEANRRGRLL